MTIFRKSLKIFDEHLMITCFVFVLAIWSVRLVSLHYAGFIQVDGGIQYSSDKVAQQNILWDWQHGLHKGAVMGDNNWFLKYPLYIIVNNFPISPLKQVFLTTWILIGATAFLIVYSLDKLLLDAVRKRIRYRKSLLAASLFLAAIPRTAFYVIAYPNSRNIEIGLTMLLLAYLYRFAVNNRFLVKPTKFKIVLLLVMVASLIADDPLFFYSIIAPLLLTTLLYYLFTKTLVRKHLKLALFITSSIGLSFLFRIILEWLLPISSIVRKSNFTTYEGFLSNINVFLNKGIEILGISLWGKSPFGPAALLTGIYIIILALSLLGLIKLHVLNKKSIFSGFLLISGGVIIFIFLFTGYVSSTGFDPLIGRYLIFFIPLEIIGFSFAVTVINQKRQQVILAAALVLACLLVVGQSLKDILSHYSQQPNAIDHALIEKAQALGLKKGYGYYDKSVIESYLSGHTLNVVSIACGQTDHTLYYFPILNEQATLRQPADRSYYIYSHNALECSFQQLENQLGKPESIVQIKGDNYIAVYDYDIGQKIKR